MRRAWILFAAIAVTCGALPAAAQDGARVQQLVGQIEARRQAFLPDRRVTASRAVLFRGELQDARDALDELASMGEAAIPGLARLLRNPRAHCRANAAYALSVIGGPRIVGPLSNAASDSNVGVRYQVALALGYSVSAAALPALNKLAGDDDAVVRNAAVQTGGVLRDILAAESAGTMEQRLTELVALAGTDPACQRLIAYGQEAVPTLIQALDAQDQGVATGAAYCLSVIGDPRGLEPLWSHFKAGAAQNTRFARYLAAYQAPEVWDYLVKILDDAELDKTAPEAQYYAIERLSSMEHADRLTVLHALIQRQLDAGLLKKVVRGPTTTVSALAAACEALGRIGDPSSLPLLDRIINDAPPPEKSIVKPLAEHAKAAIQKRAG